MQLGDFNYNLPQERIAQKPLKKRDSSKLLVLNKLTGEICHKHFYNIVEYLRSGDVLVLNNTKVIPARLFGFKEHTGGKVEIMLNKELKDGVWEALGRNVKAGDWLKFIGSDLLAEVLVRSGEICEVRFNYTGEKLLNEICKIGHTPLPPYIRRDDNQSDKEDYQTVYAENMGSVAAPTAGLHFTKQLISQIESLGVTIVKVTLNVGLGTFAPVKTENIMNHKIHSEFYSINKLELKKILDAKKNGSRIIAVGTTTTRVLETVFGKLTTDLEVRNYSGWTDIFIYPGYDWKCIDGLITNFHLPKSTLLMLVSALAGKENIDTAYKEAIKKRYRFFSYGDAMLII